MTADLPTITKAEARGDVWAIDFQFHSTVAGKPLKILFIVDEQASEALGGQVENVITASDLTTNAFLDGVSDSFGRRL